MANSLPVTWIVIPTWNRGPDLIECIKSVEAQSYKNFQVVVIDNGSEDETTKLLENQFPHIKLIQLKSNRGASYASNLGFKFALSHKADLIFRLDSDTILDENYLNILVEFIKDFPQVGIVSGYIYSSNPPDQLWFAGGNFSQWDLGVREIHKKVDIDKEQDIPYEVQFVPSTGMLISKKALVRLSGFDEDYRVYYEDTDFCLRAIKTDLKIFVIPRARMWHKVFSDKRTAWVAYEWNRSKMLFFRKNATNLFHKIFLILYAFFYAFFRSVFNSDNRGNRGPLLSTVHGLLDGLFTHLL